MFNRATKIQAVVMLFFRGLLGAVVILFLIFDNAVAKIQARVVTYPIATSILTRLSENFGRESAGYVAPFILESIGHRELEYFCSRRANAADVYVTHRKLTPDDLAQCSKEGITDFIELKMGYAALVVLVTPDLKIGNISYQELYNAATRSKYQSGVVSQNTSAVWHDVEAGGYQLTSDPIIVFIPAQNTGLRGIFDDRILVQGCQANPEILSIKSSRPKLYRDFCQAIRNDNVVTEVDFSEKGFTLPELLANRKGAMILAPASVLDNPELARNVISVDGFRPTRSNVTDEAYPLSAPVFLYVKVSSLQDGGNLRSFLQYLYVAQQRNHAVFDSEGFIPLSPQEITMQIQLLSQSRANYRLEGPSLLSQAAAMVPLPQDVPMPDMPATFQRTPLEQTLNDSFAEAYGFPEEPADVPADVDSPIAPDTLTDPLSSGVSGDDFDMPAMVGDHLTGSPEQTLEAGAGDSGVSMTDLDSSITEDVRTQDPSDDSLEEGREGQPAGEDRARSPAWHRLLGL